MPVTPSLQGHWPVVWLQVWPAAPTGWQSHSVEGTHNKRVRGENRGCRQCHRVTGEQGGNHGLPAALLARIHLLCSWRWTSSTCPVQPVTTLTGYRGGIWPRECTWVSLRCRGGSTGRGMAQPQPVLLQTWNCSQDTSSRTSHPGHQRVLLALQIKGSSMGCLRPCSRTPMCTCCNHLIPQTL